MGKTKNARGESEPVSAPDSPSVGTHSLTGLGKLNELLGGREMDEMTRVFSPYWIFIEGLLCASPFWVLGTWL